jgi:predicted metalloprotease with PDZ domain
LIFSRAATVIAGLPLAICASVANAQTLSAALADDNVSAEYNVEIDLEHPRRALITARVTPNERGLCLSRSAADTGLTHGWATFVHELVVEDSNGEPVNAVYDSDGCWTINSEGAVTARYSMLLQHDRFPNMPGDDELAYAGDWGQFWTGRALFMEGLPAEDISVTFLLPQDWAVTVPWPQAEDGTPFTFAPPDIDALLDSGFMLGTHESRTFAQGDATAHIGLTGAGPIARGDLVEQTLSDALASFTDLHGGAPTGDLAVFLGRGRSFGGGVMGRTISMLVIDDVPDRVMPLLSYIVIHEAFHLWNVNFNYADQSQMYWFTEGFAEYFTYLYMYETGLLDSETLRSKLEERASLYADAIGQLSMAEAGREKLDNYNLIYSGGMMAALALDMHILQSSNGEHRLRDVMPALFARFGPGADETLDHNSFAALIEEETGTNVRKILSENVEGTQSIPTAELIDQIMETIE